MRVNQPQAGFTLIEVLVVLVITSLTASLLVNGLESTWRNFDKLSARHLRTTAGQLPRSWFADSVHNMILRHPNTAMFKGSPRQVSFFSVAAPDTQSPGAYRLTWQIRRTNRGDVLTYQRDGQSNAVELTTFSNNARFEYLTPQGWSASYSPNNGRIPRAIRIKEANSEWAMAVPLRPEVAETPAELRAFGAYEF